MPDATVRHFVHYVKRTVVPPNTPSLPRPSYVLRAADRDALFAPTHHAAPGARGLARQIRVGDYIWVFSQLDSPWGPFCPSLDGVIRVGRITGAVRQGVTTRYFHAAADSEWFPLHDATALLQQPLLQGSFGLVPVLGSVHRHVGQSLRVVRELGNVAAMEAHAQQVKSAHRVFISYRMLDGTEQACRLALQQVKAGHSVFYDFWSLPRRIAERREKVVDRRLRTLLLQHIARSDEVLGVRSDLYAERGSFSRIERGAAVRAKKFVLWEP